MSKFPNARIESLYSETPNAEEGGVDELGWYGLYREDLTIVTEDSQGFVDYEDYVSEKALMEAWAAVEKMYSEFYRQQDDDLGGDYAGFSETEVRDNETQFLGNNPI